MGNESGSEENRKRKRRAESDDQNLRARPRPRLQDTHGISSLQKINYESKTCRQTIRRTCELYDLDLDQLMHEIGRSAYLMNLPIFVDEYTEIDTWEALRTHLESTAYRSGAKMQRIRAKPATCNRPAQNDPILYVHSVQETPRAPKLHGKHDKYSKLMPTN